MLALSALLVACGGEEGSDPDADAVGDTGDAVADTSPGDTAVETADDTVTPDNGGPDVVPDTGTDAVPDATPDGGPKPQAPLPIGAGVAADLCDDMCTNQVSECPLAAVGGSVAACLSTCKQRLAVDGWWLANYTCFSESCDATLCQMNGPPLLDAEICSPLCTAFNDCDLLEVVELPPGEVNACRASCAGNVTSNDIEVAGFPCALTALKDKCSLEKLGKCFGADPVLDPELCAQSCAPLYLDQSTNTRFCQPDSELRDTWPAAADCQAACMKTGTPDRASRFSGCLLQNGCDDPTVCLNPPSEDDQACIDGCKAFGTLCAGQALALTAVSCPLVCTGVVLAGGKPGDSGAKTCVERLKTCPQDAGEQTESLFACVLPKSADCHALCDALVPCASDAGLSQEICLADCTFGTYGEGVSLASKATCVGKSAICTDVLKCLTPEKPDPVCEANCAHRIECADGPIPDCVATCTDKLKKGGKSLATAVCEILSPCNDLEVCSSLPNFEAPATCVAACDSAPDTCAPYADDCKVACMGALTGASLTVGSAACVVGKLGVDCTVAAVKDCQ
ncbi:MAG: hypothetical protein R3F39_01875 [Myxococcota bacterium]